MKLVIKKEKPNLILSNLVYFAMIAFFYACGGGGGGDSSETGSVSFSLALQNPGTIRALSKQTSEGSDVQFECRTPDYEIDTIEAQVKDENGEIIAESERIDCEVREATIEEVAPGDNITVCIFARDTSGEIRFSGKSEPVVVVAGEVTDAGLITLIFVNSRLTGDFIGTGIGFDDFDFFPWTARFDAEFDGAGAGSFQDLATSDEDPESGTLTYNLDFDGSLTATLSDGTVFDGILNPDNNILAVADTDFTDDDSIEMDVVIKKSAGLSNAILNGEYIGVRISSVPSTALTTTTFDGDGNGVFQFLAASDGNVDIDDPEFTYSIESDGAVTISRNGAVASGGIVNGDGTVASLVDTAFRGIDGDINMAVSIKTSSGLSNATIDGDYVAVRFGINLADFESENSDPAETGLAKLSADGEGNMVFEVDTIDSFDATYDVDSSNGRIIINLPNGEVYEGIVSGNGDIFTIVNTDLSDQFIDMGVAIRKGQ